MFRNIDTTSIEEFELNCSALLVLSQNAQTNEFCEEMQDFLVKHLRHEKSRLVRKTCAYALKTIHLPQNDSCVQEFFVLLAALEEPQVNKRIF